MSFWNNPENNSLKTILIVVIVAALGYFVYTYMQTGSLGGAGRVINAPGATINITPISGTEKQSCRVEKTDLIPGPGCAQVNADCTITKISDTACDGRGLPSSKKAGTGATTTTGVTTADKAVCKVELTRTAGGDCVQVYADCSVKPATGCTDPELKTSI